MMKSILNPKVLTALEESIAEYIQSEVARQVAAAMANQGGGVSAKSSSKLIDLNEAAPANNDQDYKDWLAELEALDFSAPKSTTASNSASEMPAYKSAPAQTVKDTLDDDFLTIGNRTSSPVSEYKPLPVQEVKSQEKSGGSDALKPKLSSLLKRVKTLRANGSL